MSKAWQALREASSTSARENGGVNSDADDTNAMRHSRSAQWKLALLSVLNAGNANRYAVLEGVEEGFGLAPQRFIGGFACSPRGAAHGALGVLSGGLGFAFFSEKRGVVVVSVDAVGADSQRALKKDRKSVV